MAMTPAAAGTTGGSTMATKVAPAPFLFRGRNLIFSCSPSSPRSVLLPRCIAPIAVRSLRLLVTPARCHGGVVAAASTAGNPQFSSGENENPYEILGISPFDGFDQVKMAYKRKQKEAENSQDAEFCMKLERAYNAVMIEQLRNRKKGVAYGSIQVSKDIKYADNQPIVSWGPRYSRSTKKDLHINVAISTAFIMCTSTMARADWKPLQFLCFAYFYRILEKLKATEPAITPIYNEYGEVQGRGIHMAKRVLRSLGLVLGSILATSLGYTGLANLSQFFGRYIPSIVYNFQELIVTTASSVLLCILASYYR